MPNVVVRRIVQLCPTCRTLDERVLELTYEDGYLARDRSVCGCGRVLWDSDVIERVRRPILRFAAPAVQLGLFS